MRSFKMKKIDHNRSVFTGFEMMFMCHLFKRTLSLFIYKSQGLLHICDLCAEYSCFEKMFRLPRNSFIFFNQAKPGSCYSFFFVLLHGFFMQLNTAAEIKHSFWWCFNKCGEMNQGHRIWIIVAGLIIVFFQIGKKTTTEY